MIELKLINNTPIVLNSDLIEFMESTPDTVISLSTGKKIIVRDSVTEIIDKIVAFRKRLGSSSQELLCSKEAGRI